MTITKKDDDEMPHMFDLSEVQASLDAFLASEKHKTELAGYDGCVARGQHAILAPLTLWRAQEFNRGTDPNTLMNAIVGMCTSTIVGELVELFPGDIDAQFKAANGIMRAIGEEIGATIMGGRGPGKTIEAVEAGNA